MSDDPPAEPNEGSKNEGAAAKDAEPVAPQVDKKAVLGGALVGVLVGAVLGAVAMMPIEAERSPFRGRRTKVTSDGGAPAARRPEEPMTPSFAQQGEDLVMMQMLSERGVTKPTYVDIGAHEPVIGSNTYWFYKAGGDGVLIEPNPVYAAKLRAARPRDTVLEVGVGVSDVDQADYFVFDGDGQLNTFSKKQADTMVALHHRKIVKTMKRKLVKLNEILEANFKKGSPHVISVDAEGMDLDILKSIDWKRWRPMLVCAETADPETGKVEREIVDFMAANGYTARGGSYVNTIFLDDEAQAAK